MDITEAQANRLWELWTYLESANAASHDRALNVAPEIEVLRDALGQALDSARMYMLRVIPEESLGTINLSVDGAAANYT